MLFVLHYRSAPVAKKKETTSIFSSKLAFSEKSNDSGEFSVSLQSTKPNPEQIIHDGYRSVLTAGWPIRAHFAAACQLNRAVFE